MYARVGYVYMLLLMGACSLHAHPFHSAHRPHSSTQRSHSTQHAKSQQRVRLQRVYAYDTPIATTNTNHHGPLLARRDVSAEDNDDWFRQAMTPLLPTQTQSATFASAEHIDSLLHNLMPEGFWSDSDSGSDANVRAKWVPEQYSLPLRQVVGKKGARFRNHLQENNVLSPLMQPRNVKQRAYRASDVNSRQQPWLPPTMTPELPVSDDMPLPDPEDKDTILALAVMSNNAYTDPSKKDWIPVGPTWTSNMSFGLDNKGLRGYVFASSDPEDKTLVIAFKGTTIQVLGVGGPTAGRDKFNDNIMFSCCCGRVDRTWRPTCDCFRGNQPPIQSSFLQTVFGNKAPAKQPTCSVECLAQNVNVTETYYNAARLIYNQVRNTYPDHHIWFTGHSLGGALASMMSLTTGYPAFAYQSPGDYLYARRLGFDLQSFSYESDTQPLSNVNQDSIAGQKSAMTFQNVPSTRETSKKTVVSNAFVANMNRHAFILPQQSLRNTSSQAANTKSNANTLSLKHHPTTTQPSPHLRSTPILNIHHFGNLMDPIFTGQCRGRTSLCYIGGYALETKCHVGFKCLFKVPGTGDTNRTIPLPTDAPYPGPIPTSILEPTSIPTPTPPPVLPTPDPEPQPPSPPTENPKVDIRMHSIATVIQTLIAPMGPGDIPSCKAVALGRRSSSDREGGDGETEEEGCTDCESWQFIP